MKKQLSDYRTTDFIEYIVIGTLYNGKKFKSKYSNWFHLQGINFYNANIYGVLKETGKRVKLYSVCN